MKNKFLNLILIAIALTGCASAIDSNGYTYDPWEPVNRKIFVFNDTLDTILLKPIATGYHALMPDFGERRVNNFFGNLDDVGSFANSVLQLEFEQSMNILARVINNTVFGLGGLFDVATPLGNPKIKKDFGSTLDHYGIASGPYIVIPILGPSTLRDGFGLAVDRAFFEPLGYYNPDSHRLALTGAKYVQKRANLLSTERAIGSDVGDKYLLVRDSWLQYRWNQLYGEGANTGQQQAIDDIFAEELQNTPPQE
ncbi:MAG: ABC transporter [Cardiobacteriales bacterium]|nr:MAG: ABC transporter [Cardiobacteriales bacterium]